MLSVLAGVSLCPVQRVRLFFSELLDSCREKLWSKDLGCKFMFIISYQSA